MRNIDERLLKLGNFKIRKVPYETLLKLQHYLSRLGVKMRGPEGDILKNSIAMSVCINPNELPEDLPEDWRKVGMATWMGQADSSFENSFDDFKGFKEVTLVDLYETIGFGKDNFNIKKGECFSKDYGEEINYIQIQKYDMNICKCIIVSINKHSEDINIKTENISTGVIFNNYNKITKNKFLENLKINISKLLTKL